ncbi:MAG: PTS fructose transporter subunit IIC [Acholeplasmataceae bacterium]|jgi:PTS system fructose-specific IIC component|nr:PTS fructose transporter subunit IIC [Acholeplasmataceae bacterium]
MKERFNLYKHIMNGLSFMLPLVVAGGLLIAIASYGLLANRFPYFNDVGLLVLSYTYPILAAYIAYSIADRPGIAPGIIAGALALTGKSYFLGALLGGFAAGYTVELLKWLFSKTPKSISSLKPMLIYPLLGVLITSLLMLALNYILSPFSEWLVQAIIQLDGLLLIITAMILGGLMAIDLGGPINKIAFFIGIISIVHTYDSILMAAVMVSGMIPPLAIALALTLFKKDFTQAEYLQRKNNMMMGLSFISEGAIPFVKTYKAKVHFPIIIGSILGAMVVAMLQASIPAPHGGIWIIFFTTTWWKFLIALFGGTLIAALLMKIMMLLGAPHERT